MRTQLVINGAIKMVLLEANRMSLWNVVDVDVVSTFKIIRFLVSIWLSHRDIRDVELVVAVPF